MARMVRKSADSSAYHLSAFDAAWAIEAVLD